MTGKYSDVLFSSPFFSFCRVSPFQRKLSFNYNQYSMEESGQGVCGGGGGGGGGRVERPTFPRGVDPIAYSYIDQ